MILHGNFFDLFIAFGAGVLVSFTPCVYPLLPITVATIAGANAQKTRVAGFLLSLVYTVGLAITYSILAIIAGLTGMVFGVIQNSPWAFVAIANLFLLFALVMLDVVPFPTFGFGGQKGVSKGVLSVLLMGIASGFIVGPCTAPVLGGMLLQIAAKKDLFVGGALILVFALGMSTLLLLAGTFSGFLASLPKSGPWMDRIKKMIGLAFIITAEVYLIKAGGLF
jgi:cytochrome c-type biogenesis protein